jgi:hypothetical protein
MGDQRFLRTTCPWAVIPLVYPRTFYTDLHDLICKSRDKALSHVAGKGGTL